MHAPAIKVPMVCRVDRPGSFRTYLDRRDARYTCNRRDSVENILLPYRGVSS